MKKILSSILCIVLVMAFFTGCGKEDTKTDAGVTAKTSDSKENDVEKAADPTKEVSADPVNIKVWHDGDEGIMLPIQDKVNETLASEKISVTFEKRSGLTDQIKLYGNDASNGPDMYIYAHDSLGIYAEMGVLAPITDLISEDKMADLLPMTIDACTYKDTQYLLPIYFETLLFMYNKDLWIGDIPSTTEGLYEYMVAHTDDAAGTYAVVNQHSTAYNVAPFINAFGGYIINSDAQPGLSEQATMDAITYNTKFAKLQADGDYNTVTTLFNEGKAQAIVGGPWLISGIKAAGINLGIKSLADFKLPNGNGLAPYSGVQGIGVMSHSIKSKKAALSRVLEVIASPELGIDLANKSNCAPANSKAYEDPTVAGNEMIYAMKLTAETAQPMPNVPEMNVMWSPTETLLALVNKSNADVAETAKRCQEEALTAIADMQ